MDKMTCRMCPLLRGSTVFPLTVQVMMVEMQCVVHDTTVTDYYLPPGRGRGGVVVAGSGSSNATARNLITATAPAKNTKSRPILLEWSTDLINTCLSTSHLFTW